MKRDEALAKRLAYLVDLEVEYDMTIRLLAVLVERVQEITGADEIQVSDQTVADQPDLSAWRNLSEHTICMKTVR